MSHKPSKKKLMEREQRASASSGQSSGQSSGKVENDRNKPSGQGVTQKNESQRSPSSRSDRESKIGTNQSQARQGGVNSGVSGR